MAPPCRQLHPDNPINFLRLEWLKKLAATYVANKRSSLPYRRLPLAFHGSLHFSVSKKTKAQAEAAEVNRVD